MKMKIYQHSWYTVRVEWKEKENAKIIINLLGKHYSDHCASLYTQYVLLLSVFFLVFISFSLFTLVVCVCFFSMYVIAVSK